MLSLLTRKPDRRDDGGFTLTETLVAMIVFGIAIAMVYTALIKVQKYTTDVQGSADANFQLRQAVAVIDRQVRSGNVLYSPANETSPSSCTAVGASAGTCMRVYTQANGAQRCVQWQGVADPCRARPPPHAPPPACASTPRPTARSGAFSGRWFPTRPAPARSCCAVAAGLRLGRPMADTPVGRSMHAT